MLKTKNLKSTIGILGYGEVGQAVAKFYKNPRLRKRFGGQAKIKDLKRDDGLKKVEILNICIPWSKNFLRIAKKEIQSIKPKLTIIHSTVAVGTTKKLAGVFDGMVVHSPVRGMHPNLYRGIKNFVKYIGVDSKRAGNLAKKHLESLGIKTKLFMPSATTELGKLLDTTYYGVCIAWHGEMKKICGKFGVNFGEAVTDFNETYNEGYKKLGRPSVVRPVLFPPKGKIGGHCVVSNAKILNKYFKSKAIDLILKYGEKR